MQPSATVARSAALTDKCFSTKLKLNEIEKIPYMRMV